MFHSRPAGYWPTWRKADGADIHTYIHTHTYIYICMCVCVYVQITCALHLELLNTLYINSPACLCRTWHLRVHLPYQLYRMIEKSRNPFLTHVLFVKKNKLYWRQKTKNANVLYKKCWKCPPRSAMHAYRHLTPKVDRNGFWPVLFLCHGNGSPDGILSIFLAQENREIYP
jgi:hypothetical protein